MKWEISKTDELFTLISKYLSKLPSELDVRVSGSKLRFDHLLS